MLGQSAPLSTSLGQLGGVFYNDTNAHTGSWGVIYCITACSFTTLTGTITNGVSITLSPGMMVFGQFTAVTLASGSVILYVV